MFSESTLFSLKLPDVLLVMSHRFVGTLSSPSTSDRFLLFLWFMKQQVCGSKYYFILNWRSRVWVPLATESPLLGILTSQCGAFWCESRFSWAPRGYRTPGGNPPAPQKKNFFPCFLFTVDMYMRCEDCKVQMQWMKICLHQTIERMLNSLC